MKKMILWPFIFSLFVLGGCATNKAVSEQIQQKSAEQGTVFTEATDETPTPGFSLLTIRATMKTVKEGFYPLESKSSLHGKPEYPFVFNVEGQGIVWMAKGKPDTQPRQIDDTRNPEGGEGVRYNLEKKIILKPGSYNIYIGLTEENLQKEIDINLTEGKISTLQFVPVYRTGRNRSAGGSFYEGLSDFDVFLDGRKLESNTRN